jgi:hypothetical protein
METRIGKDAGRTTGRKKKNGRGCQIVVGICGEETTSHSKKMAVYAV